MSPFIFVLLVASFIVTKKKKMTTSITFFDGFAIKEMVTCTFFGGFVAKKVTVAMSLPSSMVEHVKKVMASRFFFFFFGLYGLVH